jgi:drug/metabolite transporter (DMT)-like permease
LSRFRADLLLLLAALIWGTAFVAQKAGLGALGPFLFIAGRFAMSALLLAPMVYREARSGAKLRQRDWLLAAGIGVVLCAGASIQQLGLLTTTVTNAGFITSLYIAFVPFVAWLILRTRVRPMVLVAVVVSLLGAWLLAGHGQEVGGQAAHLSVGDFLILVSALMYALHIVLLPLFMTSVHRPFFLAFAQYAVTALIAGSIGFAAEPVSWQVAHEALPAMLYTGLVSGGIGYTLQIVAQRYTPATEAALIMSLESVFAAIAGTLLLGERLTLPAALGCGLIMSGVVMIEIIPVLARRRAGPMDSPDPPIGTVPLD